MTKCYVFDLDGTLANLDHRLPLIKTDPPDWRAFFATCGGDALIEPVARLYSDLALAAYDDGMIIVSGRSDECRSETMAWLLRHSIVHNALYMRREGDHRPDHIVKSELLDQMLTDGWEPILFVDDRDQVVNMWRERGYTCLQCAPGSF
jgi:hypothetical protein